MAENGKLPASNLAPINRGQLRKDAAAAFNAMNVEARRLGVELYPTGSKSSYRTFAHQVELWNLYQSGRGNLAARPGNSNHGWGLACDFATPQMRAMVDRIGRKYGWAKAWSDAPSEWWHIKWREGVWSGADPGPSGAGQQQPVTPAPTLQEDENMIASCVSASGTLHVFVATEDAIYYTYQPKGGDWSKSKPGQVAGLAKLCSSLENRKIAGITASLSSGGVMHVFARFRDGTTAAVWQAPNQSKWSGGAAGKQIARLSYLAPKP